MGQTCGNARGKFANAAIPGTGLNGIAGATRFNVGQIDGHHRARLGESVSLQVFDSKLLLEGVGEIRGELLGSGDQKLDG